jgi:hypothetical protein
VGKTGVPSSGASRGGRCTGDGGVRRGTRLVCEGGNDTRCFYRTARSGWDCAGRLKNGVGSGPAGEGLARPRKPIGTDLEKKIDFEFELFKGFGI